MAVNKDYLDTPITYEKGVNEYFEASMLPNGALARLRNWESSPSGELRTRVGWLKGSTTSAPSSRRGRGIGHLAHSIQPTLVQRKVVEGIGATIVVTFDAISTAGNLLVIRTAGTATDSSPMVITATNFTSHIAETPAGVYASILSRSNAPATSTVTVNFSTERGTAFQGYVEFSEWKNMATSAFDVAADATGGPGTTASSGTTATLAGTGELILSVIGVNVQTSFSAQTNNFLEQADQNHALESTTHGPSAFNTNYKIATVTTAQSHDVTLADSSTWAGAIAAFKPTAGITGTTEGFYFITVDDNTDSYDTYYIDRTNVSAGTWVLLDSVTASGRTDPVAMVSGLNNLFRTCVEWTNPISWDGGTPAAVTGVSAGRCAAFHGERLWIGGTSAEPSLLYYSQVGDYATWTNNGLTNSLNVKLNDGEAIEDITSNENALIIGKQTSIHVLTGTGLDTFNMTELSTGGVAPGRTLMPTPYGTIAAGRHHVWLITGNTVSDVSRPISTSYAMTGNFITTSYIRDHVYINDNGSGVTWVLNMETGIWHEERIDTANEAPGVIYNQGSYQLMAPFNATVGGPLNYRSFPGGTRGKDFDTLTETFEADTGEIWPVGPEDLCTPRWLFLKLRQHGGNETMTGLTVTPVYNGVAGTSTIIDPQPSAVVFRERVDLGEKQGISSVQFQFDQTLLSGESTCFDIEESTLGYYLDGHR